MDGEVVHPLLGLLLDHFEIHVNVQVFHPLHARERLVERNGANRNGRVAQDAVANLRDIASG